MPGAVPRPSWRIALIASSRYPVREPFAGGLESHVWTVSRALQRRGHRVTAFAAPGSDPRLGADLLPLGDVELPAGTRRDITRHRDVEDSERRAYRALMDRLAGELRDAFDVVHNHSLHHLPIAMAGRLARPLVTTLHTPPTGRVGEALARDAGHAVRAVAVSRHVADTWRDAAPGVRVIPNGIDTGRWPVGPGGGPLVWSGRLVPEKGPHLAIDAARAAGMPLHLAGPIIDQAYFDLEVVPRLGGDVVYRGHLCHRDLAGLLGRGRAALVTPQWEEPYGLVVAEALACGTPVVAFARGGVPEILSPDSGTLVRPGDVGAMAAAIPAATALSRAAARRRAETHCSLEVMVDRLEELYARCTA